MWLSIPRRDIGRGGKLVDHPGCRCCFVMVGLKECLPAMALVQHVRPVQQALDCLNYPKDTPVKDLHFRTQPRQGGRTGKDADFDDLVTDLLVRVALSGLD